MGLVISILLLIFLANTFTDYHHLHQYAMALLCGLGILAVARTSGRSDRTARGEIKSDWGRADRVRI